MRWRKLRLGWGDEAAEDGARKSTNKSCGVASGSCKRGLEGRREHDCLSIRSGALGGRAGWLAGIILVEGGRVGVRVHHLGSGEIVHSKR